MRLRYFSFNLHTLPPPPSQPRRYTGGGAKMQDYTRVIGSLTLLKGTVRARVWNTYASRRGTPASKATTVIERAFGEAFLAPPDAAVLLQMVLAGPSNLTLIGANGDQLLRLCGIVAPDDYPETIYRALSDTVAAGAGLETVLRDLDDPSLRWWIARAVRWRQDVNGIYRQYQLAHALNHYASFVTKPPVMPGILDRWTRASRGPGMQHQRFVVGVCNSFQHLREPGSLCEYAVVLYCRMQHAAWGRGPGIRTADTVDLTRLKTRWVRGNPRLWRYLADVRLVYRCARDYIDHMVSPSRRIVSEVAVRTNKRRRRNEVEGAQELKKGGIRADFETWLLYTNRDRAREVMATSEPFSPAKSRPPKLWRVFELLIWIIVCNQYGCSAPHRRNNLIGQTLHNVTLSVRKITRNNAII